MKPITWLTCLSAIFSLALMAPAAAVEPIPTEAFARLPTLKSVKISPEGGKMLAHVQNGEHYSLKIFDYRDDMLPLYAIKEDEKFTLNRTFWGNNDRIVISVLFNGRRNGIDTSETRLLSMTPTGEDMSALFPVRFEDWIPQIQDDIVSYLPNDPDHILVQYGQPSEVWKVNVNKKKNHGRVRSTKKNISDWRADVHGNVMIGSGVIHNKTRKLVVKLATGKWKNISHRVADENTTFFIDGVSDQPDIFYVLSDHETETRALYTYNASTDQFVAKLYENLSVDVYGTIQDRNTGKALGAVFADDEGDIVWFQDSFIKQDLKQLARTFKGKNVSIASLSSDQNHYVVFIDDVDDPGYYILYDRVAKKAKQMPSQYTLLEGKTLGKIMSVEYPARDGLTIPAYITLPPGINALDDAKGLPFIVLPHGGPSSRDFLEFDYWTQFFASRGYGILQMNFRGSSGYGKEFKLAGSKQWGQAMQDDITDGTKWLIEKGYADKDRIALLGGSYGGYAALMGVAKEPDMYQCAVSFAGVTDLPGIIQNAKRYVNGKYRTRHIGNLWSDRKMLRANSPVNRADDIKVPVLLIHGTEDRSVNYRQSVKMHKALKKSGSPVTYIEQKNGDHHLSFHSHRLQFLVQSEKFLKTCIG